MLGIFFRRAYKFWKKEAERRRRIQVCSSGKALPLRGWRRSCALCCMNGEMSIALVVSIASIIRVKHSIVFVIYRSTQAKHCHHCGLSWWWVSGKEENATPFDAEIAWNIVSQGLLSVGMLSFISSNAVNAHFFVIGR